jgi:hypothetical protein
MAHPPFETLKQTPPVVIAGNTFDQHFIPADPSVLDIPPGDPGIRRRWCCRLAVGKPFGRICYETRMRENEGYEVRINGVPRTFRDQRASAFDAARSLKSKAKGDVVELVDRSTGTKIIMLQDGRTG